MYSSPLGDGGSVPAAEPVAEAVEVEVDDWGRVQGEDLAEEETTGHSHAERAAAVLNRCPVPKANGSAPKKAAIVVMRMGRKRNRQASKMASRVFLPCSRSAINAKSIIMMAFFLTMPISRKDADDRDHVELAAKHDQCR